MHNNWTKFQIDIFIFCFAIPQSHAQKSASVDLTCNMQLVQTDIFGDDLRLPIFEVQKHTSHSCTNQSGWPGLGAKSCFWNLSSEKKMAFTVLPPKNRPSKSIKAFVADSILWNSTNILTASSGL